MRHWLIMAATILLAGCLQVLISHATLPPYSVSLANQAVLRTMAPAQVRVGDFVGGERSGLGCGGSGLTIAEPPGGQTFEAYIRQALVDELQAAGLYAANAPLTLALEVRHVNLTFSSSEGMWEFTASLASSNGQSVTVEEHYIFKGSDTCAAATNAFVPAVQEGIMKLGKSPEFKTLIRP